MKLLLCLHKLTDHKWLFEQLAQQSGHHLSPMPDPQSANFLFHTNYLSHEIDVCETGYGLFQSSYKITKTLTQKKYHLALKASLCNAYKPEINIGDTVNVIKDKAGDAGVSGDESFNDLYESGLIDIESFPHYKGGFINMNNSYMNVMMPFKKVVSVTVNQYANKATYADKREKYKADIETTDGLGFVYACMYERQPFYQLNCVERNLTDGTFDHDKALTSLNNTLLDILQKL
jgi:hypothetical protein